MPKLKQERSARLAKICSEYPDFKSDGKILLCKLCSKEVSYEKLFSIKQHIQGAGHVQKQNQHKAKTQLFLMEITEHYTRSQTFVRDLCKAFVGSDIPLYKIRSAPLKTFLEKYMEHTLPSESTLRTAVKTLYQSTLYDIKKAITDKLLWISIDETTDTSGRYVANVVMAILDSTESRKFLIHCALLQKADHCTIARLFDEAVNLFGEDFNKDTILLFLTDAAPYMIKAAKAIAVFYPKVTHVTCLAHGLHRVCEKIRDDYSLVDKLIANAKKVFLKAPLRVTVFKTLEPDLPLPPQPVVTRWGTWLEAADYYAKNFEKIKRIVNELSSEESSAIKITKELLNDNDLRLQLIFIQSNFYCLANSIKKLEGGGLTLADQIKIVNDVQVCIEKSECAGVKNKLNTVLEKNTGFSVLKHISSQISKNGEQSAIVKGYTVAEILAFKYAPITSVDVERSFSMFKNLYRDNRRSFLFENLAQNFVVYCNSN